MSVDLEGLMGEALVLAARGRGHVEPNPRVGALALAGGDVVGRGWHRVWGGPHAEVEALADAQRRGARPDTVVVTLEPCSAAPGEGGKKTPPCTRALREAGIRKVIVGAVDPDPRHAGRGLDELRAAGIEVVEGVCAAACRELNRAFERGLGLDRPWTIAKWAMSLDGKIATPAGDSRWISCAESRRRVHELRGRVDAVVVGFRTVLADDPRLTVRDAAGAQPVRIVVDPRAELPDDRALVRTAREHPTWAIVRADADASRLAGHGLEILAAPPGEEARRVDVAAAWRALRARGLRRVLVEGGGALLALLWAADCVDQVRAFVAPKLVGGADAPTPLGGVSVAKIAEARSLDEFWSEPSGDDLEVFGLRW